MTDIPTFHIDSDGTTVYSGSEGTVKDEGGKYQKHFVGLAPTVTYIVEDTSGSAVSNTCSMYGSDHARCMIQERFNPGY